MGLEGHPYFLLFDQSGQLIYQYFGYHSSVKDELTDKILGLIAERSKNFNLQKIEIKIIKMSIVICKNQKVTFFKSLLPKYSPAIPSNIPKMSKIWLSVSPDFVKQIKFDSKYVD
ncbi:MAG: hypothetical protein IPO92_20330 [Saprospiraceae bacterium]|nr:hypothetical protein [Saprospiraceae bacterium]